MQLSTVLLAFLATAATTLVHAAPAQQDKNGASIARDYDRCFSMCTRNCQPLCTPTWTWECHECTERCYPECGLQIP